MDRQPPPDKLVQEAQELAAAYRRVIARNDYQHLLTLQLMELIDTFGLDNVRRRLDGIARNMGPTPAPESDPRR